MIVMINTKEVRELTTHSKAIAKKWVIAEGCETSVSVNIEHDGEKVTVMPCEYDGSGYLITDSIGVVDGELALVRVLFINSKTAMYIIDKGSLAYRHNGVAYKIDNNGVVKKLTAAEQTKTYWYGLESGILGCAENLVTRRTGCNFLTADKYLYNFIFTLSVKYDRECATLQYYDINDALVKPYGLEYIVFQPSKPSNLQQTNNETNKQSADESEDDLFEDDLFDDEGDEEAAALVYSSMQMDDMGMEEDTTFEGSDEEQ